MISAMFSEIIFNHTGPNPDFNFDCIIYPSVGNDFRTRNVAIKSSTAEEFILEKVIEFEIEESFYDHEPSESTHPEKISLAKVKGYHSTINITENGEITW